MEELLKQIKELSEELVTKYNITYIDLVIDEDLQSKKSVSIDIRYE